MKTTHRSASRGRLAQCLLILATTAFLMIPAAAAQAHDVPEATDPANGSAVRTVPTKIGLTFNHTPLAIGSVVRVEDATGTDQADGPVAIVDNNGGLIGWATFHITGSVGGSTKQISGYFDVELNAPPMTIVQGHGSGSTDFPPIVHLTD